MRTITVGRLPGLLKKFEIFDGDTVRTALDRAGISAAGMEIRVNDDAAGLDTSLQVNDQVVLTKPIKGNR